MPSRRQLGVDAAILRFRHAVEPRAVLAQRRKSRDQGSPTNQKGRGLDLRSDHIANLYSLYHIDPDSSITYIATYRTLVAQPDPSKCPTCDDRREPPSEDSLTCARPATG